MSTTQSYGKLIRVNVKEWIWCEGCGGKVQVNSGIAEAETADVFHASLQYYLDQPSWSIHINSSIQSLIDRLDEDACSYAIWTIKLSCEKHGIAPTDTIGNAMDKLKA